MPLRQRASLRRAEGRPVQRRPTAPGSPRRCAPRDDGADAWLIDCAVKQRSRCGKPSRCRRSGFGVRRRPMGRRLRGSSGGRRAGGGGGARAPRRRARSPWRGRFGRPARLAQRSIVARGIGAARESVQVRCTRSWAGSLASNRVAGARTGRPALRPTRIASGTSQRMVSNTGARPPCSCSQLRTAARSGARSVLFSSIRSACPSWRSTVSPTYLLSACARICSASTTTSTPSSGRPNICPYCAILPGSATPLASTMIASRCSARARIVAIAEAKPPESEQHMQPLARLIVSPSWAAMSEASTLTSPKSLMSTAARSPCERVKRLLRSVVLPAPR